MRHHREFAGLTLASAALLVGGCADLPYPSGPLPRVRTQDAEAILQTATPRAIGEKPPLRVFLGLPPGEGASPRVAALIAAPRAEPAAAPQAVATPVAAAAPAAPQARDDTPPAASQVQQVVEAWRRAWEAGDAASYLRHYDAAFHGDAATRADWERQRKQRLANGRIRVQLERVQLLRVDSDEAAVRFVQHYTSGKHHDTGTKQLVLQRRGADWRIVQERWSAGGA